MKTTNLIKSLAIGIFCTSLLTSCISREQADSRLALGCAAAVELFLDDNFTIKEIKKKVYSTPTEFGSGFRQVKLFAIESDTWLEIDKEYSCIFAEEFGPLQSTHRTTIYQVKVNDQTYGREGDKILGSMQDHLRLEEVVDNAMRH